MSYYIGKFIDKFREINTATLTGAIDVIVVEQPDGTFTCSPFHVRFGKMGVLRSKEKIVEIEINGVPANIHMKLGDSGEAFFVQKVDLEEGSVIPPHLTCSPIPLDDRSFNQYPRDTKGSDVIFEPKARKTIEFIKKPPLDEIKVLGGVKSDEYLFDVDIKAGSDLVEKEVAELTGASISDTSLTESVANISVGIADLSIEKSHTEEEDIKNESSETDNDDLRASDSSTNLPKTFSAEAITDIEKARKISLVSGEFRPINIENITEEGKPGAEVQVQSTLSHSNSKRRRKKRNSKKKNSGSKRPASLDLNIDEPIPTNSLAYPPVNPELANVKYAASESDLHFFSDTEASVGPSESIRPRAPSIELSSVLSDSEVETKRGINAADQQQSWNWGELPSPPPLPISFTKSENDTQDEAAAKRSVLASLIGFMKRTKHMRHSPQTEGVYLSDLNPDELDPHIAKLYFGNNYNHGKEASQISQSSQRGDSVSSGESGKGGSIPGSPNSVPGSPGGPVLPIGDVALSLCGKLNTPEGPSDEEFTQHRLAYETLASDPGIMDNPDLVVRIDGKYYSYRNASPIILSWAAYQKPLPKEVIDKLTPNEAPDQTPRKRTTSYSSWFSWKLGSTSASQANRDKNDGVDNKKDTSNTSITDDSILATMAEILHQIPEFPDQNLSSDSDEDILKNRCHTSNHKKTLRLTSEQIAGLDLNPGMNELEFSVTTAYQGTTRCKCFLFRWRWDDKVVISDIDGTITKSDVLGHVLPIVGKDWAQNGVARLFTKIKDNGYKLLYLSARAIGQSRVTREYLQSIKQEDLSLPEGPMLLNPTSLLNAFHTEVIEKKPQEFKISCLRDIMALFPGNVQPFYAGYGNKVNDVWSYQAVGIPLSRIFTINSKGEVKHEMTQTFQSTYSNLSYLVDQMFPSASMEHNSEDYSQFVFWREPICENIKLDEL